MYWLMNRITIGICDDKEEILRELERIISAICVEQGIESEIHTYVDGHELLENISIFQIVFLDIEMPEIDGIELGKQIREINSKCKIIMATGMVERFKEAFQIQALRFITKPFDKEEVKEALEVAVAGLHTSKVIDVYCNRIKYTFLEEDIQYVNAYDGYSEIHIGDKAYRRDCSLDKFENFLSKKIFMRINREIIVNLRFIEQRNDKEIKINNNCFTISRRKRKDFEQKYIEFDLKYRREFS